MRSLPSGFALWLVLAAGALTASCAAAVNITLADTNAAGIRLDDEALAGFVLAVADARAGVHGLFPSNPPELVKRVVPLSSEAAEATTTTANLRLTVELLRATVEDNAAGVLGGARADVALLEHAVLEGLPEPLPHFATSPVRHVPGSRRALFGATPDVSLRARALSEFALAHGIGAVTVLAERSGGLEGVEVACLQELSRQGVRVVDALGLPQQQGSDDGDAAADAEAMDELWGQVRANNNRALFVIASPGVFEAVLASAHDNGLTGPDFVWLFWANDVLEQHILSTGAGRLGALAAAARVLGTTTPPLDWTGAGEASARLREADDRIRQLPADPAVFPDYDVHAVGLTTTAAFAYDSAMALLVALNASMAKGNDPLDHAATLLEISSLDFAGLTGQIKYNDELQALVSRVDIAQVVALENNDAVDGPFNFAFQRTTSFDAVSGESVAISAVAWGGDGDAAPPNFEPESCGLRAFRTGIAGLCVACPEGMLNRPDDLREACAFCDLGSELHGAQCVECDPDTEEAARGSIGEPICTPKGGRAFGVVVVVLSVVGSIGAVALAGAAMVKLRRTLSAMRAALIAGELNASNAQFIAFSFHEMRNPLNGVAGALEFSLSELTLLMQVLVELRDKAHARRLLQGKVKKPKPVPADRQPRYIGLKVRSASEALPEGALNLRLKYEDDVVPKEPEEVWVEQLGEMVTDVRDGQLCLVETIHVLDTINMLSQVINDVCSLEPGPTCFAELVREVVDEASSLLPLNGVAVEVDVRVDGRVPERRGCMVFVDRQKMRHVLLVLVLNAFRYTAHGKIVVKVHMRTVEPPNRASKGALDLLAMLSPRSRARGAGAPASNFASSRVLAGDNEAAVSPFVRVDVEVSDTGGGIPRGDLAQIFNLQHQIDRGGSVRTTGLGLVLAHKIVAMHDSQLHVESTCAPQSRLGGQSASSGTRFWWSMQARALAPCRKSAPDNNPNPNPNSNPIPNPSKSLSINNNADVRLSVVGEGGDGDEDDDGLGDIEMGMLMTDMVEDDDDDNNNNNKQGGSAVAKVSEVEVIVEEDGKEEKKDKEEGGKGEDAPAAEGGEGADNEMSQLLQGVPRNLRVLLLEDVALNRKIMRRKLGLPPFQHLNWEVEEVDTGEKCIDLIVNQGRRFDVVFCDQILTNTGGKLLGSETAQRLRQWERKRWENGEEVDRMVLLACSGNATDEDKKVFVKAGMDGMIPKPLPSQPVLFRAVRDAIVSDGF